MTQTGFMHPLLCKTKKNVIKVFSDQSEKIHAALVNSSFSNHSNTIWIIINLTPATTIIAYNSNILARHSPKTLTQWKPMSTIKGSNRGSSSLILTVNSQGCYAMKISTFSMWWRQYTCTFSHMLFCTTTMQYQLLHMR